MSTAQPPAEPSAPQSAVPSPVQPLPAAVDQAAALDALAVIVKAYDVRGLVGRTITEEIVAALGAAFIDELGAAGAEVVVGYDMRDSSPPLADAFAHGARARGADVVSIGLCSTDVSYFASGTWNAPAVMFTASHNPAAYNGMKFSRAGAKGISLDTGLAAIRDRAADYLRAGVPLVERTGGYREQGVIAEYAALLRSLVSLDGIRPLRMVVDAGNGMAGLTVPAVFGSTAGLASLPIEVIPLYFELDGSFPNHEANPLEPANLVDVQRAVREQKADLGLAFDGDADRCFVVDERGEPMSPSAVTALVAEREIARARAENPDEAITVIHNLITSRAVPELVEAQGAIPVRTRVGHSLIKGAMAETGAVFGGEHSAHYYFRDFWGADNGMLAALHVLAALGSHEGPLSALAERFSPYAGSGEVNSTVADVPLALTRIVEAFTGVGSFDELDGLTVTGLTDGEQPFWWFNVRASNTEPLLRLNVEAEDATTMALVRDRVLALIRG